jgi:hypothetical protein
VNDDEDALASVEIDWRTCGLTSWEPPERPSLIDQLGQVVVRGPPLSHACRPRSLQVTVTLEECVHVTTPIRLTIRRRYCRTRRRMPHRLGWAAGAG